MAKRKSTATVDVEAAAGDSAPQLSVGTDKVIAARLDEQYHRIFRMASIVETVMGVVAAREDREGAGGEDRELTALWGSLDVVRETLENIAQHIEPRVVLKHQDITS